LHPLEQFGHDLDGRGLGPWHHHAELLPPCMGRDRRIVLNGDCFTLEDLDRIGEECLRLRIPRE
jgi:hypothetical protein